MNFTKIKSRHPAAAPAVVSQNGEDRNGEKREEGGPEKHVFDTIGQVCPFLLTEIKRVTGGLHSGDELQIDLDCTQATDSIPAWAFTAGRVMTDFRQIDKAIWAITLCKV